MPVVALLAVLAAFSPVRLTHPAVFAGVALVGAATGAAFAVPWSRLAPSALVVVPMLDLASVAVFRTVPEIGEVVALAVLPAIWVGHLLGDRGVVLVTVASVLVLALPGLVLEGLGLESWSRAVLLPIVVAMTALMASFTAQRWHNHRVRLEQQGEELESLVRQMTQHRQITEAIVQTVDVGLLALGRDGTYNSMNPRHREFLRLAFPDGHHGRAGAIGYAFGADRVTPLSREEMPSVRAAAGESFSDYTIWIGKEPAERRALSCSSRLLNDADGCLDGAVLAYKDITEVMRALQVKDDFVASVSHELRTPLTSIIGYADLMADYADEVPAAVDHYRAVIQRNAERLLMLVSDLLSTAQVESGTLRILPEPTDLAAVVHQAVVAVEQKASAAGVVLHATIDPVPTQHVDPVRLGQVADNLISNAVKYTLAGGKVHVSLHETDGEVVLEVADSGIGIAESEIEHVFTKFFRARTAEERAIPGIGLGLVITKAIVEAHGGRIDLESVEGEGTRVRVTLPTSGG